MARKVVVVKKPILQIGLIWNRKGLTFFEIIIVLVIISVISTIVIPNFGQFFNSLTNVRESEKILHILNKARAEAIFQIKPVDVIFTKDGCCQVELQGKLFTYQDLNLKIILNDGNRMIQRFYPDGTTDYPTLRFQTEDKKIVIYNFDIISGKIEIERSREL